MKNIKTQNISKKFVESFTHAYQAACSERVLIAIYLC